MNSQSSRNSEGKQSWAEAVIECVSDNAERERLIRMYDYDELVQACLALGTLALTAKHEYQRAEELKSQLASSEKAITDRQPAGYVAFLVDEKAQKGGWYIGAYHDQVSALIASKGRSDARVIPFYVATDAELTAMVQRALAEVPTSGEREQSK